jgi:hypothetical protein
VWAGKVRTALAANSAISKRFTVGGTSDAIALTARRAAANDATLNIAIANGAPSPGITEDATSDKTTAGVTDTILTGLTLYDAIASVTTTHQGASVILDCSITGRTTSP